MERSRVKSGWRERWRVGWVEEGGGSSRVSVPEKCSRVRERERGRTAKRGRGKLTRSEVEIDRETWSV